MILAKSLCRARKWNTSLTRQRGAPRNDSKAAIIRRAPRWRVRLVCLRSARVSRPRRIRRPKVSDGSERPSVGRVARSGDRPQRYERFLDRLLVSAALCLFLVASCQGADRYVIVIAHRGASGYLPEHTLAAKALAHGMGADYIEQDVVLTADDHPIVLHDIHLDTVTDVAERFPRRARADGRFYALDFTLAEIKQLRVRERIDLKTNRAVYPARFPSETSGLGVPSLAEEIQLVQGLNKSTGRSAGIYPEIKAPAWHRRQGKDISRIVLATLARFGYRDRNDPVYVQCFDAEETKRLRNEFKTKLKLVQLIGENDWNESETDFELLRTAAGLKDVAGYADGIGPWIPHIVTGRDDQGALTITSLVEDAHAVGLEVHPYTFRADDLPEFTDDFDSLLRLFVEQVGVDGLFTDFPDQAVALRNQLAQ